MAYPFQKVIAAGFRLKSLAARKIPGISAEIMRMSRSAKLLSKGTQKSAIKANTRDFIMVHSLHQHNLFYT